MTTRFEYFPDRELSRKIPDRIGDLKILAKAAAHSILAHQSVDTKEMTDLLLEIGKLHFASSEHIYGLIERLDARDSAAANRTKSELALRERYERKIDELAGKLVLDSYEDSVRRFCDNPREFSGYYVYLLWGTDCTKPVYVGQSRNVLSRIQTHLRDAQKNKHFYRVQLIRCSSLTVMNETELRLIRHFKPLLNKAGIPGGAL